VADAKTFSIKVAQEVPGRTVLLHRFGDEAMADTSRRARAWRELYDENSIR
jgi:hypothetical protein